LPAEVTPSTVVATITTTVSNTGSVEGSEVVQVYVGYPKQALEPERQLRAFKKISLKPSEEKTVKVQLTARDCSVWDSNTHTWKLAQGKFQVFVGASSRDVRLTSDLTIV
jgi:beta-glucosidase